MQVTVQIKVSKPIDKVWEMWTEPKHIVNWNFSDESWCCPRAENDLFAGGKFNYRMETKDQSMGFDFEGVYQLVEKPNKIVYSLGERDVSVIFEEDKENTTIIGVFDSDDAYSIEMQRDGWQAILNNFKIYAESN